MKKPIVFDYLDVSQFLSDFLVWKKDQPEGYSISKWAQDLGFDSPVTLRFILKKRRNISPTTMKVLISNLRLADPEAEYFENLVSYSQAKTSALKQSLGAVLIKLQRQQFQQTRISAELGSRDVFTPVVLTLMTFEDLPKTVASLAKVLDLDENVVETILEGLVLDGIITRLKDSSYHFSEKTFRISGPGGAALKKFYSYWIERSRQALELPFEVRRYRALNFALTPDEFTEVVEKLNEYSMLLLSKYQSPSFEGRKLYMYESAIFPISKCLDVVDCSRDSVQPTVTT